MSEAKCQQVLREEGKAYPRTCSVCGLGPCRQGEPPKPKSDAPRFPTMLRKMWSGGEVQAWIDEHWNAKPSAKPGEMFQADWRMRIAGIAAECTDPDAQAALDKLLEDMP